LAVGVLASTTYNNFIADLLFLSEVSHSLLVAGAPCVHPYLGKSALLSIVNACLPAARHRPLERLAPQQPASHRSSPPRAAL
jgi:hypothetical protein